LFWEPAAHPSVVHIHEIVDIGAHEPFASREEDVVTRGAYVDELRVVTVPPARDQTYASIFPLIDVFPSIRIFADQPLTGLEERALTVAREVSWEKVWSGASGIRVAFNGRRYAEELGRCAALSAEGAARHAGDAVRNRVVEIDLLETRVVVCREARVRGKQ
jgi:hypothetical protein